MSPTRRRFACALALVAVGASATVAAAQMESTSTTTLVVDTIPPEKPYVRPTLPPAPTLTTVAPPEVTTTTVVAPSLADPSLAPVCASAVGARVDARPCRIIAYYGTPLAASMGILGRLQRSAMPAALKADVAMWATADPSVMAQCAFEVIAMVAQAGPGAAGLYRAAISPSALDEMIALARTNGCITILDLQVGRSSVVAELPKFLSWLSAPDVHLALDPEWAMPPGRLPGQSIGQMDAAEINFAIDTMTKLVRERSLPPKLVIVHRFRDFMIQRPEAVVPTPEVRLLVNMDGFGPPSSKIGVYGRVRMGLATNLTGFKLFTNPRNDRPMLRPADVLPLKPAPLFINYQ